MKTLTLGEMATVEDLTGHNFDEKDQPRGKWSAAVIMVLKKREDPSFTFADALNMDASDAGDIINAYFGELEDPKDVN